CAISAGRRRCASPTASSARSAGTATTPPGGSRSAPATTALTTSASTAGRWGSDRRSGDRELGQLRDPPAALVGELQRGDRIRVGRCLDLDLHRCAGAGDADRLDVHVEDVAVAQRVLELVGTVAAA